MKILTDLEGLYLFRFYGMYIVYLYYIWGFYFYIFYFYFVIFRKNLKLNNVLSEIPYSH